MKLDEMKTTLNKIRQHNPCEDSWKKLLSYLGKTKADDEPLEIETIRDALGLVDAIWAFRAVNGRNKEIRLFACTCAEYVLHFFEEKYPNDNRPRRAIEVARAFANGEATAGELKDVRVAVRAAERDVERDVARAARDAEWDIAKAARDAMWAAKAARAAARSAKPARAAARAAMDAAWAALKI